MVAAKSAEKVAEYALAEIPECNSDSSSIPDSSLQCLNTARATFASSEEATSLRCILACASVRRMSASSARAVGSRASCWRFAAPSSPSPRGPPWVIPA